MGQPLQVSVLGLAWYTQANYKRILEVMEDAHVLPATFEKWLYAAEKVLERAKRQGVVPVKAHIDPETFPDWCRARGLNVNADARMQFANLIAKANHMEGRG